LFDREFDEIAEIYESKLSGAGRRWYLATRNLRLSYEASRAGHRGAAVNKLLHALMIYPESIVRRPFWGCFHQLVRKTPEETGNT
jgi:hypothetical protein